MHRSRTIIILLILLPAWTLAALNPALATEPSKRKTKAPQAAPASTPGPATPARPSQELLDALFLAQEWQASQNFEAQRRALEDALTLAPGAPFIGLKLAQWEARAGNLLQALSGLDAVLAGDPANLAAHNWRGHVLLGLDRLPEAQESYRRALELDASNAWALTGLACCLIGQNKEREAAQALSAAQAAAGDDASVHMALGEVFASLGLPVNARLELERCLELSARNPRALAVAGEVYLRLGLESLALDSWRQALALNPQDAFARTALTVALGRKAEKALAQGRMIDALNLWRSLLGYDPHNPQALERLRQLARERTGA